MNAFFQALYDLRLGLRIASDTYASFAEHFRDGAFYEPLAELAWARSNNDLTLVRLIPEDVLDSAEVVTEEAIIRDDLGLSEDIPERVSIALLRAGRVESALSEWLGLLASIAPSETAKNELEAISQATSEATERLRWLRARALADDPGYGGAKNYVRRAASGAYEQKEEDVARVDIWFGTNRSESRRGTFGPKRANQTSYGRCSVIVPKDRRIGSLGDRNWITRLLRGDDRVRLSSTSLMDADSFWLALSESTQALEDRHRTGLVFIHGYNTSFVDAAHQTAQLKVDLDHIGPAAFFSWPSMGKLLGYTADEATIQASEAALQKFLADFSERTGVTTVNIIAHSMGNRALLRAMNTIAQNASAANFVPFGQIFLAAPDVDADVFKNLAVVYPALCERTTMYVANNDRAIGASRRLHNFHRAGLAPPVTVIDGIDTVDASNVNIGLLGHGYVAEVRDLLADIFELLQRNTPPEERFGLRLSASQAHWEFKA